MRVAIRTDSSHTIGAGHAMRCLTIANELRRRGAEVLFLCRDLPGNCIGHIRDHAGFAVAELPFPAEAGTDRKNADEGTSSWLGTDWETDLESVSSALSAGFGKRKLDWLVVDHYSLDQRWESRAREFAEFILAIDDIADRKHDCDALIDQNFHPDAASRYRGLVPSSCRLLLGPEFVLLRAEFHLARKRQARARDGSVRRIHIFYGGADPTDETTKAVRVLAGLGRRDLDFDIVAGGLNPNRERIRESCRELPNATYHFDVRNMAELEDRADLCLGAGGTATWERSFLGLPAITTIIADNQAETTLAAAAIGALHCLGYARDATSESLRRSLDHFLGHPEAVRAMSEKARALMDRTREPEAIVALAFGLDRDS